MKPSRLPCAMISLAEGDGDEPGRSRYRKNNMESEQRY